MPRVPKVIVSVFRHNAWHGQRRKSRHRIDRNPYFIANFPRRRHLCQDRQAVNMFRKKRQLTGAPAQVRPAPKIVKRQAFTPHERYQFLDSGQTVSNSMANIAGRGANHGAIIPNRGLGTCTRPSLRHISDTFSQTPKPAKQDMAGRQRFRNCPGPSDELREATRPKLRRATSYKVRRDPVPRFAHLSLSSDVPRQPDIQPSAKTTDEVVGASEQLRLGGNLVPKVGLEPTRYCYRGILNPLRLPFRHLGTRHALLLNCSDKDNSITGAGIGRSDLLPETRRHFPTR